MDAFDTWYREQRPRVLAACLAMARDLEVARDATDEAFARALEHWESVGAMASPGGWVQTVALNHLRRGFRRLRVEGSRWGESPRSGSRGVGGAPAGFLDGLPDPDLWRAVRRLPPRQQTAIVLRYVHDLPVNDIAEAMSISRGAVASMLDSARAKLRAQLVQPITAITSEERING